MRWRAWLLAAVACGGGTSEIAAPGAVVVSAPVPEAEPLHVARMAAPSPLAREDLVRYHCARQLDDLREIQRAAILGDLATIRDRAPMLQVPPHDARIADCLDEVDGVAVAAAGLAAARTVEDAQRGTARVALACSRCHTAVRARLEFAPDFLPPARDPYGRHRWAVTRAWQGVIAPSADRWDDAIEVIAMEPAGQGPAAARLQQLAQIARWTPDLQPAARAAIYGQMLGTCAGCHVPVTEPVTDTTASPDTRRTRRRRDPRRRTARGRRR